MIETVLFAGMSAVIVGMAILMIAIKPPTDRE